MPNVRSHGCCAAHDNNRVGRVRRTKWGEDDGGGRPARWLLEAKLNAQGFFLIQITTLGVPELRHRVCLHAADTRNESPEKSGIIGPQGTLCGKSLGFGTLCSMLSCRHVSVVCCNRGRRQIVVAAH